MLPKRSQKYEGIDPIFQQFICNWCLPAKDDAFKKIHGQKEKERGEKEEEREGEGESGGGRE